MLKFSTRLYRWLLRAYPPAFRHDYGDLMAQVFRDRLREAMHQSRVTVGIFWLRALWDLVWNATEERMNTLPLSKRPTQRLVHFLGILAVAATWPLLWWALTFSLLLVGDPSGYGGAAGTFQAELDHLIAHPPVLLLLPLFIQTYSSLILARSIRYRRQEVWLLWRITLVTLAACAVMIGVMLAALRAVTLLFPPDTTTYIGLAHYPLGAYIVLMAIYTLLVIGLLRAQRWAVTTPAAQDAQLTTPS